ncbi:hypothetical protein H0H87_009504 [Tephrocybe sp. NHM501043]|nr:hypothetical protein H0H87_009504 [Tephrocybe sp. NHM501043]
MVPGDERYDEDIEHWATSSTQPAACSVRPANAEDVSIALKIIGSTRTPFAVKGGGHAANVGFSSTLGVHINMKAFSEVVYHPESRTAVVGSGLIWDEVYAALEPHGVTVVGGRVSGVGVAGFTLGGGYSFLTNQYGLTLDNVVAFELVRPSGAIVTVTRKTDPFLFFGLKGGGNNFGIVTRFTLKTFPQGQIWAGIVNFASPQIPAVTAATARFSSSVTDPKASTIVSYIFAFGQPLISQAFFYDGPTPPEGIFDDFMEIPSISKDVGTRNLTSFMALTAATTATGASR